MMRRNRDEPGPAAPRTIRLARPGALRAGPFRAGRTYRVGETVGGVELTPELADRLVAVKGFEDVAPAADDTTEQTETQEG